MGSLLVEDATTGVHKRIRGIVPNTFLNGFIHNLIIKIANKEFTAPIFIADSEDVTPIFGRTQALDLFKAYFDGDIVSFEEK